MNSDSTKSSVRSKSQQLYDRALKVLPGGISRNTIYRRPHPYYADYGKGCEIVDVDGVARVDFANNMASLIHGHAYPPMVEAVSRQLTRGTAFTMATEQELAFAEDLCARAAPFDKIRFVNSGTEAVMVAIKAARAFTGRPKIAKAEGAYHGTYDYAEVSQVAQPGNWGERDAPTSVPVASGTPQRALDDVVVIPFNDVPRAIALLDQHAAELSCVLLDPLPHRVGLIPASEEFVNAIRDWTTRNHSLFIFDEVITFRSGFSGAQEWYKVQPDLTTLGKIIGGGFPVGAIAGADEFMAVLDPARSELPLPHSGTFSANPMTMTAGRIAMRDYDRAAVDRLNRLGDYARGLIGQAIADADVAACVTGAGSLLRVHLKPNPPVEYRSAFASREETALVTRLVDHLYRDGMMLIKTCTAALSTPMSEREIDRLAESLGVGLKQLKPDLDRLQKR